MTLEGAREFSDISDKMFKRVKFVFHAVEFAYFSEVFSACDHCGVCFPWLVCFPWGFSCVMRVGLFEQLRSCGSHFVLVSVVSPPV